MKTKSDFVVIELDMGRIEKFLISHPELLYIQGNATSDEVLIKAGVERAKGLVSALPSDSENLFLVLSAKELNPKLRIVSRAVEPAAGEKIKKAGAESVVLPEMIGGLRIASSILRPNVVSFLDIMLRQAGGTVRFEEVVVNEGSELVGSTLTQAQIPQRTGLVIIAIKSAENHSFIYNPKSDVKLNVNDALIVIGSPEQLVTLRKIAKH
jgi:voltage-gated potassium channel